jgi:hypothetical protein
MSPEEAFTPPLDSTVEKMGSSSHFEKTHEQILDGSDDRAIQFVNGLANTS